jgi:hypothetical protein
MTNPHTTQPEQHHTVLVHYHTDPLRCGHCKSKNVKYYDGSLGYEAIRCHNCHIESDLNSDNFNSFDCPCKNKPTPQRKEA